MGKLEHLQGLVAALTPEEQSSFREWYLAFDADAWDDQMARDAAEGRLEASAERARLAHRNGKTTPLRFDA